MNEVRFLFLCWRHVLVIQKPRAENGPLGTLHMNVVARTLWMLVRVEAANKAWLQSGASVVTRMNSACLRRARDSCDVHFSEQEAGACAFKSRAQKKLSRRDCVCIELTPGGAIFFLSMGLVYVHSKAAHRTRFHRFDVAGFCMRPTRLLELLVDNQPGLFANVLWCMSSVTNVTCAMGPFRAHVLASL